MTSVARAGALDAARIAAQVVLPTAAIGPLKRRPGIQGLAQRLQFDRRAITVLRRLRARYGPVVLHLPVPGRPVAVPLSHDAVATLLDGAPEPFSPASAEKAAALGTFQPHGVLISTGGARAARRHFNESVLETYRPLHELAGVFTTTIARECDRLLEQVTSEDTVGELDWSAFAAAWWAIVRQIVLGKGARDDTVMVELLNSLRRSGNWAQFGRRGTGRRERFFARLNEHLDRAEPDCLAGVISRSPAGGRETSPPDQVAHWLFAFDAAGMATFRALALLATHPEQARAARTEPDREGQPSQDPSVQGNSAEIAPRQLSYLRACVLESVRLWPTTPLLLREATRESRWDGASVPAGTGFLVYTPLFHRDPERLAYADEFAPQIWLDGRAEAEPALVPFSAGPAACPGRNLVLFVASTVLEHLLQRREFRLDSPHDLEPARALPATLDNYTLRLATQPLATQPSSTQPPR